MSGLPKGYLTLLDHLSLWSTRFLLTSYDVAVGLQLLKFTGPL